jgi:hypothetical protein
MTTPIGNSFDTKMDEYNISGIQKLIPIEFNPGNYEFVTIKVNVKFLNQVPIDIAFTNQHALDNFPDSIEFKTIVKDSENSFNINAREFRLPLFLIRTTDPDKNTNILLNYDVFPVDTTIEKFENAGAAAAGPDDKKWNDFIYIIVGAFVIIFIIIFIIKLTKNKGLK